MAVILAWGQGETGSQLGLGMPRLDGSMSQVVPGLPPGDEYFYGHVQTSAAHPPRLTAGPEGRPGLSHPAWGTHWQNLAHVGRCETPSLCCLEGGAAPLQSCGPILPSSFSLSHDVDASSLNKMTLQLNVLASSVCDFIEVNVK